MKRLRHLLLPAGFLALATGLCLLPFLGAPGLANPKTAGVWGLWINFIGTFHPLFLHLPIGALLLLVTMEGLALVSCGRIRLEPTWPLLFALGTAVLALVTGYSLYLTGNYTGELLQMHKRDAFIFCWVLAATTAWHLRAVLAGKDSRLVRGGYYAGLGASVVLMTMAGHYGGEITHGDPLEQWPAKVLAERRAAAEALQKDPVVYSQVLRPVFEVNCVYCHGPDKQEGKLRMDTYTDLLKGGEKGSVLVAGDPSRSQLVQRLLLPIADKLHMPPSDKPQPTAGEIELISWWVARGAPEDARVSELDPTPAIRAALADLVSPEERKAREEELQRKAREEVERVAASKAAMAPGITSFEAAFPASLKYLSSGTDALRLALHSHAHSFAAEGMDRLRDFAGHLEEADLTLSKMDSATLARVAGLPALQRLNVSQTAADDAFVEAVAGLPNLEVLNLFGTRVTPACAGSLAKMKKLRVVYVGDTGFDAAAAAALAEKLSAGRATPVRVVGAVAPPPATPVAN
ncbi:MAG: c-type cytochrome domain-containing protein [Chthoniobacterales bacterium]|jgi:uncharacterized membrane protein